MHFILCKDNKMNIDSKRFVVAVDCSLAAMSYSTPKCARAFAIPSSSTDAVT